MAARPEGHVRSSPMRRTCVRDDFKPATNELIGKRAGWLCSNPECRRSTVGAAEGHDGVINIGVAAHITAASLEEPRYDPALTSEERRHQATAFGCARTMARPSTRTQNAFQSSCSGSGNATPKSARSKPSWRPGPCATSKPPIPRLTRRSRLLLIGWAFRRGTILTPSRRG